MKLNFRRICRNNEGVSEVIGGLLLITIVVTCMTSLMLISNSYLEMQKDMVNSNIGACQRFIDYLNNLFPPATPGNTPPEIKYLSPPDGKTGVPLRPTCSVMVCDDEDPKLFVTFFFYLAVDTPEVRSPEKYYFTVDNNTIVECPDVVANSYSTEYGWEVSVSDGSLTVTSDRYYFTTRAADPGNAPPQIIEPIWPDEYEEDVPLFPVCYVTVTDTDNTDLTVSFYFNTGTFYAFVDSVDIDLNRANPAKVECRLTGASRSGTTYDWIAVVTDGTNVVSGGPYYFKTVYADPS